MSARKPFFTVDPEQIAALHVRLRELYPEAVAAMQGSTTMPIDYAKDKDGVITAQVKFYFADYVRPADFKYKNGVWVKTGDWRD